MKEKRWETYEEVAQYLIQQFSEHFKLNMVEGKQSITGSSGTEWELDGKGIREDGSSIVIIECKRHTTRKITQEVIAGLAYRINDTSADGGIIVSPLGLQIGAEKVASHEKIISVRLDQNSTTQEYVMEFLNNIHVGLLDSVDIKVSDSFSIIVTDRDGNIIDRRQG
ncbi:restriction endonuclease [Vibrio cholerae]|uniref:restriction endonuclease n=1 Tax=Vibrio cholerae TaxID=666 RepID=UPI000E0A473D|nr:restriction endonuclease [Vibrio cholerae]